MSVQSQTDNQPPPSFLAALGLAAGFMAFVAWDQSHWWQVKEDYSFGWLVPLLNLKLESLAATGAN